MIKRRWIGLTILLVACGGGAKPDDVRPANSPSGAVTAFLQAVIDSNLTKMAGLWGTSAGPSSQTKQPDKWQQRVAIMQAYLRHDDSRILSDTPGPLDNQHTIQAQLRRSACTWTVPFVVVQLADKTWIVNSVDVATAGNPARPCNPSASDTSTTQ